jgi:hypothetical protein
MSILTALFLVTTGVFTTLFITRPPGQRPVRPGHR